MAGVRTTIGGCPVFLDFPDGTGGAVVNGREWRWDYHDYLGPTFYRKDGSPRKCQCPTVKAVWTAFEAWLAKYQAKKPI